MELVQENTGQTPKWCTEMNNVVPASPRSPLRWMWSIGHDKKRQKQNKIIDRQSSRQMEFVIIKRNQTKRKGHRMKQDEQWEKETVAKTGTSQREEQQKRTRNEWKRGSCTQKRNSLRLAAAATSYEKPFLHMTLSLSTPVAASATRLTASIAVPQSHYVSWQFIVGW